MSEYESMDELRARRKRQQEEYRRAQLQREYEREERERERLRQQQEQRDRRKNYSGYSSSFARPPEPHSTESFHDIDALGEPHEDIEQWYLRFHVMSNNHYPINSRERARKLLNMKPGEIALNKQFKFGLLRIMHPDKSGHPNSTRFFQMLTDAIHIIENRGSGKRNRKTHKRRAKPNKHTKRRKNRSRRS
jgi:hypothetical protein